MTDKARKFSNIGDPLRIILLYEHAARELPAARLLQLSAREHNAIVEVYQIYFEWIEAYSSAKRNGVDVVVLPWCYTKEELKFVLPFQTVNPDLAIINMHQEQIAPGWMKTLLLPKDNDAKDRVFHCCWAPYFYRELVEAGVRESRIRVTGNTRLRAIGHSACTRSDLSKEFGIDESKRWILFAETKRVDRTTEEKSRDFLVVRNGLPYDKWSTVRERTRDSLKAFIKQTVELSENYHDEYEVIYRPHPGSNIDYDLGPYVKIIDKRPISDWLSNVDVFCTDQSTSAFEAEIAGLPVLILECVPVPDNEQMPGVRDYYHIQNIKDIDDQSISAALELQASRRIYERYVGTADGDEAIANFFEAVAAALRMPKAESRNPAHKRLIVHFTLFEIATKALYQLGLIQFLRWPRTAYMLFNDIPY